MSKFRLVSGKGTDYIIVEAFRVHFCAFFFTALFCKDYSLIRIFCIVPPHERVLTVNPGKNCMITCVLQLLAAG